MTTICFVADVHVGNSKVFSGVRELGMDERCRQRVACLRAAVAVARERGADAFVVCGDLFDAVDPDPRLVAEVQRALGDIPAVLILGNHEMVSANAGDHALAPLEPIARVVDRPAVVRAGGVDVVCVPYRPGPARAWLARAIDEALGSSALGGGIGRAVPRVLALHLGISDASTPFYLDGAEDSVSIDLVSALAAARGAGLVVAGNWHRRVSWRTRDGVDVLQVGALCPTGFADAGLRGFGGVAVVVDGELAEVVDVPGPRFLKCSGAAPVMLAEVRAAAAVVRGGGGCLYVSASVPPSEDRGAVTRALEDLRAAGEIAGGRVHGDAALVAAAANDAAARAAQAVDFEAAVRGYVSAMALDADVDRGELAEVCVMYLRMRDAGIVRDALRSERALP
jgi:hypothetical protein